MRTKAECREVSALAGAAVAEAGKKAESPTREWYQVTR